MNSLRTEPHQAVVSWFCSLIARSCMHDMCILVLAEDLEARAPKSSAQTKTTGNTRRAKARPTKDGPRGLQRQRKRHGGCRANRFRRKTRRVFITWSKPIFKKSSQYLTTCVLLLYYCTSIDITAAVGKTKIRDHSTRTLTLTLIGTLLGDLLECWGLRRLQGDSAHMVALLGKTLC